MRIVALASYASIATASRRSSSAATHYLAKPADADDIVAALHRSEGARPVSA